MAEKKSIKDLAAAVSTDMEVRAAELNAKKKAEAAAQAAKDDLEKRRSEALGSVLSEGHACLTEAATELSRASLARGAGTIMVRDARQTMDKEHYHATIYTLSNKKLENVVWLQVPMPTESPNAIDYWSIGFAVERIKEEEKPVYGNKVQTTIWRGDAVTAYAMHAVHEGGSKIIASKDPLSINDKQGWAADAVVEMLKFMSAKK